jgi:hypothetical protein
MAGKHSSVMNSRRRSSIIIFFAPIFRALASTAAQSSS